MANSSTLPYTTENPHFKKFVQQITNPLLQRLYMLGKLPAVWFMGARIQSITPEAAQVTLPYGWRSKNPFRSTYFAAQAAAAELSTGILVAAHIQGRGKISMLVTHMEADFVKKATDKTVFVCDQGQDIVQAIQQTLATGEGQSFSLQAKGIQTLADGTPLVVSSFMFEWSIKAKS